MLQRFPLNSPDSQAKGRSGFTLIEAIFSIAIASLVITGVFSYFSTSLRGVAHNEDTLDSIKSLQRIVTQVKFDAFALKPFTFLGGAIPIDLYRAPSDFPLEKRSYGVGVAVLDTGERLVASTGNHFVQKTFELDRIEDGQKYYRVKRVTDGFLSQPTRNLGEAVLLENSIVNIEREVERPDFYKDVPGSEFQTSRVTVKETYLFAHGQKILYRHYPEPFFYLARCVVPPPPPAVKWPFVEEEHCSIFGRKKGKGKVTHFGLDPTFHYISYEPFPKEPKVFEYHRMKLDVGIVIEGEQKGTGPEGRDLKVSFSVTNPFLNSQRFKKGRLRK